MPGTPSALYSQIRQALLDCGPLASDDQLRAVLAHPSLKPWRNSLPQAPNPAARADAVIAFLSERRRADTQENALVLLLRILSERHDPADECHPRLARLADELALREGETSTRFPTTERSDVAKAPPLVPASMSQEEDLSSLQRQLAEARQNLRLIQERVAEFVLSTDIPLQLVKEERRRLDEITELEQRIAQSASPSLRQLESPALAHQTPPDLSEDKLKFLCCVYLKASGRVLGSTANSEDVANELSLTQLTTIEVAQYLERKGLVKFKSWYIGIKITHQGIVKIESDLLESRLLSEYISPDEVKRIEARSHDRLQFLHHLNEKTEGDTFKKILTLEMVSDLGLDRDQVITDIIPYLSEEGWIRSRTNDSITITVEGTEMCKENQ